jgi:hypothetical protein
MKYKTIKEFYTKVKINKTFKQKGGEFKIWLGNLPFQFELFEGGSFTECEQKILKWANNE